MTKLPPKTHNTRVGGVAVDQLKSIISRIEKLESEKSDICCLPASDWDSRRGRRSLRGANSMPSGCRRMNAGGVRCSLMAAPHWARPWVV